MKKKVTAEELENAAWEAALTSTIVPDQVPKGWKTVKQIAKKFGRSRSHSHRLLAEAVESKRCEMKMFRVASGTRVRPTPHYRPL